MEDKQIKETLYQTADELVTMLQSQGLQLHKKAGRIKTPGFTIDHVDGPLTFFDRQGVLHLKN